MTTPLSPESARGWFHTFYGVTEKSTPITLLFILAIMALGYFVVKGEVKRLHTVNTQLWQELQQTNDQLIKLALNCGGGGK